MQERAFHGRLQGDSPGELPGRASRRRGFTLIELLAVILIIGVLASLLVVQLSSSERATRIQSTRQFLITLETVLSDYSNNQGGDYPPSSFSDEQGVGNDGNNVGIEALVIALYSDGWEAGGALPDLADQLINSDADRADRALADFPTRDLLEIPDSWENPIAYIHRRDYNATARPYLTLSSDTGEEIISVPEPYKNPTTGRYYRAREFQLISAGPDGRFGTEDDITNFNVD